MDQCEFEPISISQDGNGPIGKKCRVVNYLLYRVDIQCKGSFFIKFLRDSLYDTLDVRYWRFDRHIGRVVRGGSDKNDVWDTVDEANDDDRKNSLHRWTTNRVTVTKAREQGRGRRPWLRDECHIYTGSHFHGERRFNGRPGSERSRLAGRRISWLQSKNSHLSYVPEISQLATSLKGPPYILRRYNSHALFSCCRVRVFSNLFSSISLFCQQKYIVRGRLRLELITCKRW